MALQIGKKREGRPSKSKEITVRKFAREKGNALYMPMMQKCTSNTMWKYFKMKVVSYFIVVKKKKKGATSLPIALSTVGNILNLQPHLDT